MLKIIQAENGSKFFDFEVEDMEKMVNFYHLIIKLPVKEVAPGHWTQLQAGDMTLNLYQKLDYRKQNPVIVFYGQNEQELKDLLPKIKGKMVVKEAGIWTLSGIDPEGNQIIVYSPTDKE